MLGSNYLRYNDFVIPNPESLSIDYENVESVALSEAGTDIGIVTRLEKMTLNCTFNCTSTWYTNFRAMGITSTGTLLFEGVSRTVRARITNATLAPYSEFADRTDGLWTVTMSFTEV